MQQPSRDTRAVTVVPLTGVRRPLAYAVPEALLTTVVPGSLVRVSLRGRRVTAVVWGEGAGEDAPEPERLKWVEAVVQPQPVFDDGLRRLLAWVAEYYAAPLDQVLEAALPAAVRAGKKARVEVLLGAGRAPAEGELERLDQRAPKQAALCRFVRQQPEPVAKGLVLRRCGATPATAAALVRAGLLVEMREARDRVAYDDAEGELERVEAAPPQLNEGQQAAVTALEAALDAGGFGVHLLQGVTGSGKTEVYLRLLERVVRAGGGAIVLVPEVTLAPQTVGRIRARLRPLGVEVAVWHSHLSGGERLDAWRAAAEGRARVVAGARSAIFAPVRDLRLVIVDEEHEPAYKQGEAPRYHGRDTAVVRARLAGATCLLGSATPSLESLLNVRRGRYLRHHLPVRVDHRTLPLVHIVDMRAEAMNQRGPAVLSRRLADFMKGRLADGEQTILFLNRRGYNRTLVCRACGHVEQCAHCSVSLVYHRTDDSVRCHLCGHAAPAPVRCPGCGSPEIRWRGPGTQRIEDVVRLVLPTARVERIDADTMLRRHRFREVLNAFRAGRIDVLVGTQMIAKGLDFPGVTLVGLVDADISLHLPDFRASERTFQILVQVAGRSGRGERAGEVVVQTCTPHLAPVQFAKTADVEGFTEGELAAREPAGYPPYRHLVRHLFSGPNPEKVAWFAENWARGIAARLGDLAELRGPAPAPLEKVQDAYRFHLWYFTARPQAVARLLATAAREYPWPPDVRAVLDVDPVDLG